MLRQSLAIDFTLHCVGHVNRHMRISLKVQTHFSTICKLPQDETTLLCPISTLTTPYASAPPPLTIPMLLRHPQDMPGMPPSTCLILSTTYHPYACIVASQHSSNATLTLD
ncbi:hypothetical protein O181_002281 [Austropuccinia psidii MF-1]|uniref:Uncharacterized protein n=1 Tax=Austropuccinia psidii MF-1 TaxID=1389203 RepID=A0A9Q3GD56_9BASI|nr:hypothetical protein [Austropuccinia psidii MF-1]